MREHLIHSWISCTPISRFHFFVIILTLMQIEAFGQQGRLMGRIMNTESVPVAGALIYISSKSITQAAVANAQGYYTFLNVPPEKYKIRTSKRGYESWSSEVEVSQNAITRVDVKLSQGNEEIVIANDAKKGELSTAVKKTISVPKKKDVSEVVVNDKSPDQLKEITAQLKSEGEDEKNAADLINLTNENLNADDIEQVATLESNVEILGGLEKIYQSLKYPDLALKAGVEGKLVAQVYVDKVGNILKVNFLVSSNPILDAEVMRVLTEETQFKPARISSGNTVPGAIVIPFTFKIKK